jgi:hypothetical protein
MRSGPDFCVGKPVSPVIRKFLIKRHLSSFAGTSQRTSLEQESILQLHLASGGLKEKSFYSNDALDLGCRRILLL